MNRSSSFVKRRKQPFRVRFRMNFVSNHRITIHKKTCDFVVPYREGGGWGVSSRSYVDSRFWLISYVDFLSSEHKGFPWETDSEGSLKDQNITEKQQETPSDRIFGSQRTSSFCAPHGATIILSLWNESPDLQCNTNCQSTFDLFERRLSPRLSVSYSSFTKCIDNVL